MHSVKPDYLVCAVTVHLHLVLFEWHGNTECACVRSYVSVRVI